MRIPSLILAFLPLALYGGFLWRAWGKMGGPPLLMATGLGGGALLGSAILQELLPIPDLSVPWSMLYERLIRSALIEEVMRYLLTLLIVTQKKDTWRKQVFIDTGEVQGSLFWGLWGAFGGLVFATLETILYALRFSGSLWVRLLPTSLIHGTCGALIGQGTYKEKGRGSFIFALTIHGVYNVLVGLPLFFSAIGVIFSVLVFFAFWAPLLKDVKK